ncbi:hypothetical protein [Paractinoplanes durhamensis]|uniref:hypothetical protein n=1 Tax=Paractinoplanes durhamensis TaxID=113563 RepID=UPI0036348055
MAAAQRGDHPGPAAGGDRLLDPRPGHPGQRQRERPAPGRVPRLRRTRRRPSSAAAVTGGALEESVRAAVESWGYAVHTRIGSGGYRIDLGVLHPGHEGEVYAIGIECDGAMYHSSPVARDRDRLRGEVLDGLGWRLYRVWGTAWYRDRAEEETRLRAAIENAVADTSLPARAPGHKPDLLKLLPVS